MKDTVEFGKKIKELRLKNDMSLRDLGEKSGVSYSFINSIENGRFNPSRDTVISLVSVLKGADKNEMLLLAGFAPDDPENNKKNPPWATSKDKLDFRKMLEEDAPVMFDGVPLDEEDKEKVLKVMEAIFWDAKKKNKRKPIKED